MRLLKIIRNFCWPKVDDNHWNDVALTYVESYVNTQVSPQQTFRCEQVRAWAEGRGLNSPTDARAWGHVMRRAEGRRLIVKAGTVRSANRSRHGGYITEWEKR